MRHPCKSWTLTAALAVFGFILAAGRPAHADLAIAEELMVELSAEDDSAGSAVWINTADDAIGDFLLASGAPIKGVIEGVTCLTFNSTATLDAYQCENANTAGGIGDGLIGIDATRSIEVWAYNPVIASEETLLSWAYRGGPDDGTNMSFNYGYHQQWGAVGHWGGGGPDMAWTDNTMTVEGAPSAGVWHHLVYTYDGTTTSAYADGELWNSEVLGAGVINTHGGTPITIPAQLDNAAGAINFNLRGTLSIAIVRIHDGVLTPEQVKNNYDWDCATAIDCPVSELPVCENCPSSDIVYSSKLNYVRVLQFTGFPAPTGAAVTQPAGATLALNAGLTGGRLTVPVSGASFNVTVEVTSDAGMQSYTWTVSVVDPPERDPGLAIAGELFVELDAAHDSAGEATWLNSGTSGDFQRVGDPILTLLGPESSPAVDFNWGLTNDAYQCAEIAPAGLTGPDPTRSIEVWSLNPALAGEETLVAWSRRGGPCGTNMSFNYGADYYFGAVGHWCHDPGPDLGWANFGVVGTVGIDLPPLAGAWHHLVYTYDGEMTRVYSDGIEVNQEFLGAGTINTHGETPITLAAQMLNATGAIDFAQRGTLALGQVRVHDGVLTLNQIRQNYELERDRYGAPEIPDEAPSFLNAPLDDELPLIVGTYSYHLVIAGVPTPTLQATEPAGATISETGVYSYVLPDPAPDSFTVRVTATNAEGSAEATWPVTVIMPEPLTVAPVHRYSFTEDATDSVGGAHGTPYGNVTFEGGHAVLDNDGLPNSNAVGLFPDPADPAKLPPGAYIDLPNGIISALGNAATFEAWVTWDWDGVEGSYWERIFDFGTSTTGEDWSDGGVQEYYIFSTPRSGIDTTRFGYRQGAVLGDGVERYIDGTRLAAGEEQHVVAVWDGDFAIASLYINGVKVAEDNAVHIALSDIPDVNNWLGRSQWVDAMFDGSYNEFRIYDYPLTPTQIMGNSIEGADCLQGLEPCGEVGPTFVRGDPDSSGVVNISDGIRILSFLFTGGAALECDDAGDTDDDGALTITDAIKVFGYLFLGQGDPAAPAPSEPAYEFEDCTADPTDTDALGCSKMAETCNP